VPKKKSAPNVLITVAEPDANSYPIMSNITSAEAAIMATKFLKIKSPFDLGEAFLVRNWGFFDPSR
jgi:hypothetical protein